MRKSNLSDSNYHVLTIYLKSYNSFMHVKLLQSFILISTKKIRGKGCFFPISSPCWTLYFNLVVYSNLYTSSNLTSMGIKKLIYQKISYIKLLLYKFGLQQFWAVYISKRNCRLTIICLHA